MKLAADNQAVEGSPVPTNPASAWSEWRRHWTVLIPCAAGITLVSVHTYSLGVMIGPLEQEFGWSRTQISVGSLIIAFIALLIGPLVGIGIDRYGPRRIGLLGVLFYCIALAAVATTSRDISSWWVRWIVLGIASMFIMPTVWTAAINGFFDKSRGMALAIALCGTGVAAAFVPSLSHSLIEGYGWRGAYVGLAATCFLATAPLIYFFFRGPADHQPGVGRPDGGRPTMLVGLSAREGLTSPSFLKLAGAALIFAVAASTLTANAVPVLLAQGFERATAAAMAGLIGVGSIIGRLCGGYLLDRLDAKKVAAASVIAPVVTVTIFLTLPGALWPAAIGCFVLGLSVGTELDACAYLAARYFGMRSFGTLFGTINGLLLFGNGVAPVAANYVYDVTDSYHLVLMAISPACVLAAVLFALLGRYPDFGHGREVHK